MAPGQSAAQANFWMFVQQHHTSRRRAVRYTSRPCDPTRATDRWNRFVRGAIPTGCDCAGRANLCYACPMSDDPSNNDPPRDRPGQGRRRGMKNQDWEIPRNLQPDPDDYSFDLERALKAVVSLKTYVPADAFTANTLGTERAGSGVVINDKGLVATIGYLITEAETIWITSNDGQVVPGHALAFDQETGFGLVQALGSLNLPHARAWRFGSAEGRRSGGLRGRRRPASFDRDPDRRPAGVRRLLGIRAG